MKNGQPKESRNTTKGTLGLPKGLKAHGNRGFVVPVMERDPGSRVRFSSNVAGTPSTVSTDGIARIRKIQESSKANPNCQIHNIYKILYDVRLFEMAYENLKSKPGNMAPGITFTTLGNISLETLNKIISQLRDGSFKFAPGRRVNIPKANGANRPLTIAPPRDKLVQEVMRFVLEAIYESGLSKYSHGFRPGKSCHSALKVVKSEFQSAN